jgi:hypothetical protein
MTRTLTLSRRRALVLLLASAPGCRDDSASDGDADGHDSTSGLASSSGELGSTTDPLVFCVPGEIRCADASNLEKCAPTGKNWVPEPCPSQTECEPCDDDNCTADRCVGPCDSVDELPSSAGCSFIANRQLTAVEEFDDGLIVANPNSTVSAHVILYQTPEGTNQEEVVEEIDVPPLESHAFILSSNFVQGTSSMFRTGGTYRAQSDVPIVAYHHAPYILSHGNDSSMLLPETSLRKDYIALSYGPNVELRDGQPSYFEIVALENFTTIEWFPPVATAGNGLPIPAVPPGGKGTLKMNRFDTARIAASESATDIVPNRDISGTVIKADKPIWVTSGVRCGRVPTRDLAVYPNGFCDPLQEMPIPLDYWGNTYVGVAAPPRETEEHWWRVYAGTDGVEIETGLPPPMDTIVIQERGQYVDFSVPNGTSFVFRSTNGVFMPVEYLESKHYTNEEPDDGQLATYGDPSMYQMVPTEQFLDRYVFATALGFEENYVQIIRPEGGPDLYLDGDLVVETFVAVEDYEVATVDLRLGDLETVGAGEGPHLIESEGDFGIVQVGYSRRTYDERCLQEDPDSTNSCPSSYAYPGGMKSDPIYIP